MNTHWLEDALQAGLQAVDQPELIRGAAEHVQLQDVHREERPGKRISPTLIAEECRLSRIKRYRHHDPQPGWKWRAVKSGRPSASSNMHTLRGTFAEGMAITALRAVEQEFNFIILGVSPVMVFESKSYTRTLYQDSQDGSYVPREINYLAYPDVVMLKDGVPELIQMKCPSVHAIKRYRRDGPDSVARRYGPQAAAELYIGRQMGLPLARNNILLFAFEGTLPGSDEAKAGQEITSAVLPILWNEGINQYVESVADEIVQDDEAAERGEWPAAYVVGTKWPCDYCNWPRVATSPDVATCEENQRWEPQRSRSLPAPAPIHLVPPLTPAFAPTPLAASSAPSTITAGTDRAPSSTSLQPLSTLLPPALPVRR